MQPKYFPIHRQPQNENIVPLTSKKPLALKSALMGSSGKERGQVCVYELSLLLACFKQTSYSQVACANELSNFQKCYYAAKMKTESGGSERRAEKISKDEINGLLKKYTR